MPISEAPNDWNMNDSAFVENLGPSMTMMVPRSCKLQPCCFVESIRICRTDREHSILILWSQLDNQLVTVLKECHKQEKSVGGVLVSLLGPLSQTWTHHSNAAKLLKKTCQAFSYLRMLTMWHCPHLPAAAAQCIDISCPQQQTCSSGFAAVGPCWDRQTDGHCTVS